MSRFRLLVLGLLSSGFIVVALTGCEPQFTDHICESDLDCFPGEHCVVSRCRPMPQEDVGPDEDVHTNECGGSEVLDASQGDPCGPCDLDQLVCADGTLACDGETECPEIDLITTTPSNVTTNTATFNGRVEALPLEALEEVGFCYATTAAPTLDDTCVAADPTPTDVGNFSVNVVDLAEGTTYYVRAYSSTAAEDFLANEIQFTTQALVPALTPQGAADAVLLSWAPVAGATGYEIFADGSLLETLNDPDADSFEHTTAPAGTITGPQNVQASTNRTDGIQVTFGAAVGSPGAVVEYVLVAIFGSTETASDPVTAQRSAPVVTRYEVLREGAGEDWIDIDTDLEYLDTEAPLASVTPGPITVSKGEHADFVRLTSPVSPTVGTAPEKSYTVRAVTTAAQEPPYSNSVTGRRSTSAQFTRQWQRSTGTEDDDFQTLAGATTSPFNDDTAPASGAIRYYRVQISVPGGETAVSASDSGFRAHVGTAASGQSSDVTATTALVQATVTAPGSPAATNHGFTYSLSQNPVFPAAGGSTVVDLGEHDGVSTSFSTELTGLPANSTIYVRAFMSNFVGTNYSTQFSFTTQNLPAPEALDAQGSGQAVTLSWQPVDGATGYRIIRNTSTLTTLDSGLDELYVDGTASAPSTQITGLSVEQEPDAARLLAAPLTGTDGNTATYDIAAMQPGGAPSDFRSTVQGQRTWETPQAWWEFHDGDSNWTFLADVDASAPGYLDETVPTDGSTRSYRLRAQIGDATDTLTTSVTLTFVYVEPEPDGEE